MDIHERALDPLRPGAVQVHTLASALELTTATYHDPTQHVILHQVRGPFGACCRCSLPMFSRFGVAVNGGQLHNSEVLYLCVRFAPAVDIQQKLLELASSLVAKHNMSVPPLDIPDFTLLGHPIQTIVGTAH